MTARSLLALPLLLTAGCAGATIGSGVGDKLFERPPYAAGARAGGDATCVGHLPVAYQRGGSHEAAFDPGAGAGTPVALLLAEMNAYLDTLGRTVAVALSGPVPGTPPDVRFGCELDASGDCVRDEGHDVRRPRHWLAVGRPSASWVAWARSGLDRAGVERALVLTLEVGQYWPRQKNFHGQKDVQLGVGHAADLPWLTSLDQPVSVLQLTGALVDRDGKAARIAAEGLLVRRTSLVMSSFGAQALVTDEDVERLQAARRDDLAHRPLVWQAAIDRLMNDLAGASPGDARACSGRRP